MIWKLTLIVFFVFVQFSLFADEPKPIAEKTVDELISAATPATWSKTEMKEYCKLHPPSNIDEIFSYVFSKADELADELKELMRRYPQLESKDQKKIEEVLEKAIESPMGFLPMQGLDWSQAKNFSRLSKKALATRNEIFISSVIYLTQLRGEFNTDFATKVLEQMESFAEPNLAYRAESFLKSSSVGKAVTTSAAEALDPWAHQPVELIAAPIELFLRCEKNLTRTDAAKIILKALNSKVPSIRQAAIRYAWLAGPSGAKFLRDSLKDASKQVRVFAAYVIGKCEYSFDDAYDVIHSNSDPYMIEEFLNGITSSEFQEWKIKQLVEILEEPREIENHKSYAASILIRWSNEPKADPKIKEAIDRLEADPNLSELIKRIKLDQSKKRKKIF
ncbi:MAG: hypothetical protein JWQ35_2505 [Bacteriovoracaceae bacterium]|nr:hypothetical protein [Bacteriovoracaceae bacterium]